MNGVNLANGRELHGCQWTSSPVGPRAWARRYRPNCRRTPSTLRVHDGGRQRATRDENCRLRLPMNRLNWVAVKRGLRNGRRQSNSAFSRGGCGSGLAAEELTFPSEFRSSRDHGATVRQESAINWAQWCRAPLGSIGWARNEVGKGGEFVQCGQGHPATSTCLVSCPPLLAMLMGMSGCSNLVGLV